MAHTQTCKQTIKATKLAKKTKHRKAVKPFAIRPAPIQFTAREESNALYAASLARRAQKTPPATPPECGICTEPYAPSRPPRRCPNPRCRHACCKPCHDRVRAWWDARCPFCRTALPAGPRRARPADDPDAADFPADEDAAVGPAAGGGAAYLGPGRELLRAHALMWFGVRDHGASTEAELERDMMDPELYEGAVAEFERRCGVAAALEAGA